ncbi:carboxypeptidase M32 [Heyndrickxia sp. NPDC080065]|uniref:carboxypeptidase M32 n=1 Tax=Heyndrickxia sp. NPDC080065 TaxID=3390568 RepID=UPI003D00077E
MEHKVLNQSIQTAVEAFKKLDEKITLFTSATSLLDWDQKVMAPKKGRKAFSKAIGVLKTEEFKLMVSEEMGELLSILSTPEAADHLDEVTKARVRERKDFYDRSNSIPSDMFQEYAVLTAQANESWEEAREKNDFSIFCPDLEKIVEFNRKVVEIYGYEKHPYDALLNQYEPGLTVEKLDPLFAKLREKSIDLLQRIQQSAYKPPVEIFEQSFSVDKQKEFNRYLLPILGFDMEAGRLDETVHPFAQPININDVRITTRYIEKNVRAALFGTIHEAGHGIYEQNIDEQFEGTALQTGASYGIHESQSRFLENMVGRSEEFWKYFYPKLQEHFPSQLEQVSEEDFYRAINTVQPSMIRVEADELTYNLHIMIRYEIEKALLEGEIEVKDLPSIWNQKMEEYLGITPATDSEGVLQDVHWSFGGLGYFPSYSLGNLYAAQILNTIKKECPNFYSDIENANFDNIQEWLKTNIHQYGKLYTPNDLILKVTGEELNANYLVEYLEQKYSRIYQL